MDIGILLIIMIIIIIIVTISGLTKFEAAGVILSLIASILVLYNQTHTLKQNFNTAKKETLPKYEQSAEIEIPLSETPDLNLSNDVNTYDIGRDNVTSNDDNEDAATQIIFDTPSGPFTYSKNNENYNKYNNVITPPIIPIENSRGVDSLNENRWRQVGARGKQTIDARAIKGSGYYKHIFSEELDEAEKRDWRAEYDDIDNSYVE